MLRASYIGKRVICVDDSSRPNEIPTTKWPQVGEVYTIKDTFYSLTSKCRTLILEELDIEAYWPYKGFAAKRFRIYED